MRVVPGGEADQPGWVLNREAGPVELEVELPPNQAVPPWLDEPDGVRATYMQAGPLWLGRPRFVYVTLVGRLELPFWPHRN